MQIAQVPRTYDVLFRRVTEEIFVIVILLKWE